MRCGSKVNVAVHRSMQHCGICIEAPNFILALCVLLHIVGGDCNA
jgi:hypothetical protein